MKTENGKTYCQNSTNSRKTHNLRIYEDFSSKTEQIVNNYLLFLICSSRFSQKLKNIPFLFFTSIRSSISHVFHVSFHSKWVVHLTVFFQAPSPVRALQVASVPLDIEESVAEVGRAMDHSQFLSHALRHARRLLALYMAGHHLGMSGKKSLLLVV